MKQVINAYDNHQCGVCGTSMRLTIRIHSHGPTNWGRAYLIFSPWFPFDGFLHKGRNVVRGKCSGSESFFGDSNWGRFLIDSMRNCLRNKDRMTSRASGDSSGNNFSAEVCGGIGVSRRCAKCRCRGCVMVVRRNKGGRLLQKVVVRPCGCTRFNITVVSRGIHSVIGKEAGCKMMFRAQWFSMRASSIRISGYRDRDS